MAYDLFACVCICILEHGCVYVCLFFHLIRLLWVSTRLADAVALETLVDLPRLAHFTEQRSYLSLLSTNTTSWLPYSNFLYLDFQLFHYKAKKNTAESCHHLKCRHQCLELTNIQLLWGTPAKPSFVSKTIDKNVIVRNGIVIVNCWLLVILLLDGKMEKSARKWHFLVQRYYLTDDEDDSLWMETILPIWSRWL